MREAHRLTGIRISTGSVGPLTGTLQIDTPAAALQFELNEETAHELSMHLDRFLTQAKAARRSG